MPSVMLRSLDRKEIAAVAPPTMHTGIHEPTRDAPDRIESE